MLIVEWIPASAASVGVAWRAANTLVVELPKQARVFLKNESIGTVHVDFTTHELIGAMMEGAALPLPACSRTSAATERRLQLRQGALRRSAEIWPYRSGAIQAPQSRSRRRNTSRHSATDERTSPSVTPCNG